MGQTIRGNGMKEKTAFCVAIAAVLVPIGVALVLAPIQVLTFMGILMGILSFFGGAVYLLVRLLTS
jgi:hypothetical protein